MNVTMAQRAREHAFGVGLVLKTRMRWRPADMLSSLGCTTVHTTTANQVLAGTLGQPQCQGHRKAR